jgi:NAD(P)-dependent dehydrogenase (short-subunit alcohol dehydrogenase family)
LSTDEVFRRIMDVNFFGPIKLSKLVLNYIIDKNTKNPDNIRLHQYAIANIGSVSSLISAPYRSACKQIKSHLFYFHINYTLILI